MENDSVSQSDVSGSGDKQISVIDQILMDIEGLVDNPRKWCFGLCSNPKRRSAQLGNPPQWRHWNAETYVAALAIAENLAVRGLRNTSNGDMLPSYVHIHAATTTKTI